MIVIEIFFFFVCVVFLLISLSFLVIWGPLFCFLKIILESGSILKESPEKDKKKKEKKKKKGKEKEKEKEKEQKKQNKNRKRKRKRIKEKRKTHKTQKVGLSEKCSKKKKFFVFVPFFKKKKQREFFFLFLTLFLVQNQKMNWNQKHLDKNDLFSKKKKLVLGEKITPHV